MGLFDRKPTPQQERTEAEREQDRAERAARRSQRLGLDDASVPPLELPPEDFGPYEGQVEAARALGVEPVAASDATHVQEPAEPTPAPPDPEPEVALQPPDADPLVEPLADPPDFAWEDRPSAAKPAPEPAAPEPAAAEPEPAATDPEPVTPAPDPEPVRAAAPVADPLPPTQPHAAPAPPAPAPPAQRAPTARRADPTRPTPGYRPAQRPAPTPAAPTPAAPQPPARRSAAAAATTPPEPASRYDSPSAVLDGPVGEDWSQVDEPFADNGAGKPPRNRRAGKPARPPGRPRGPRGVAARVFALTAIAGVLVIVWLLFSIFEPLKGDPSGKLVAVTVPKGASVGQVGDLLAKDHVVSSGFFFKLRARISGKDKLLPGRYRLPQGMTYAAALDVLQKGPPKPRTTAITITEGRTRKEASRLLAKTSLKGNYYNATSQSPLLNPRNYGASRSVNSLEGFLFPATYTVRVGAPITDLVNQQLKTFRQRFARVDLSYAKKKKLSAYDVLIIASMIEREAQLDRDRPLIAAVIYNRLRTGNPLGIDATLRYALDDQQNSLKQSQLDSNTPYNTRNRQGLPPTPIGNPGMKSIQAAAHPANNSKVLFFVVKPCGNGGHVFSNTLDQFNRDAAKYDAARIAKGGSPVKC